MAAPRSTRRARRVWSPRQTRPASASGQLSKRRSSPGPSSVYALHGRGAGGTIHSVAEKCNFRIHCSAAIRRTRRYACSTMASKARGKPCKAALLSPADRADALSKAAGRPGQHFRALRSISQGLLSSRAPSCAYFILISATGLRSSRGRRTPRVRRMVLAVRSDQVRSLPWRRCAICCAI